MSRKNSNASSYLEHPRLSLEKVSYLEDEESVLQDVSFTVGAGEMLALTASPRVNEALLNMVSGFADPLSGTIEIEGQNLGDMNPARRAWLRREKIGIVRDEVNLVESLTVAENIALSYELSGMGHAQALSRAGVALANIRAFEIGDCYPQQLDRYQQLKVAVARAGLGGAKLILVLEPTASLKAKAEQNIFSLLRTQVEKGSSCLLFTTRQDLAATADRVVNISLEQVSCGLGDNNA